MSETPPQSGLAAATYAVEIAARGSYGRLIAFLASRWKDVAAAEDALSEAFVAALRTWPAEGVPERPEAWLLAVAQRRLVDGVRHARVRSATAGAIADTTADAVNQALRHPEFPDERLALLFVCAHPAIAEDVRTPLMLQTVLGLDAARIASAFLVAPATMGQRLSRAKSKIRDAGIRFEVPEAAELPARLESVLEAIYAAYGTGWDNISGADPRSRGLAAEAVALGRVVAGHLPGEPEARGLLALMLHCEARRPARRDPAGAYVPISRQDVALWSAAQQQEAEAQLAQAARAGRIGRFQLEAAIQSAHARRATSGETDWPAIVQLYAGLLQIAPTVGAQVGHAAALAETRGANAALAELDLLPSELVRNYQPYWALRAALHRRNGELTQARAATQRALGLTEDPAVRAFLTAAED